MRGIWLKRTAILLVFGIAAGAVVWFASPRPIPVDLQTLKRGPMTVAVEDEGKTRLRHVYTVSAPISGRVLRISPPRHLGDEVVVDDTVIAVMQPAEPSFLDVRSRTELEAAVESAEAAVAFMEAEVRRLEAALEFARRELKRAQALAKTETISPRALEKATLEVHTTEAALGSAKAQREVRRHELHNAKARLIDPLGMKVQANAACCIELRAPISGRILKIHQESEAVVPVGAPLIDIGDPLDLEVVADLLSSDAVQIKPGADVRIDGWGGAPLRGQVSRIDPAGFLKVSALGIEEQRVRTVINLIDPPDAWSRLGHEYRVMVQVAVWSGEDALAVPVSALFRKGDEWAVFAVRNGRARSTNVTVGRRNSRVAQVLSGLLEGDRVVLHPSDRIRDGVAVSEREDR